MIKNRKKAPVNLDQIIASLNGFRDNPKVINEHFKIGFVVMVIFGLRVTELKLLRVDSICLEDQTLLLIKDNQQPITLPLPDNTLVLFTRLIKLAEGSEYLFPDIKRKGTSFSSHAFTYAIQKSIPTLSLSGLRLFLKELLFEYDYSPTLIAKYLNKKTLFHNRINYDYLQERKEIYSTLGSIVLSEAFTDEQLITMGDA
jgi:integrase